MFFRTLRGVSEGTGLGRTVSLGNTGCPASRVLAWSPLSIRTEAPDWGVPVHPPLGSLATLSLEDRTESFLVM